MVKYRLDKRRLGLVIGGRGEAGVGDEGEAKVGEVCSWVAG